MCQFFINEDDDDYVIHQFFLLLLTIQIQYVNSNAVVFTEEWSTYLSYVRNLDFFETPDYGYLHRLFLDALDRHGWQCDWIFDWNEKQVRNYIVHLTMSAIDTCATIAILATYWTYF